MTMRTSHELAVLPRSFIPDAVAGLDVHTEAGCSAARLRMVSGDIYQQAGNDISDPSTRMLSEADKAKKQRLLGEKVGRGVDGSVMSPAACSPDVA